MGREKESERAQSILYDLQNSINEFEPSTAVEADLEGQLVEQVDDLGGLRELRLVDSTANLPSILWVLTALLTIESLDNPFSGGAKVWPHAFESALENFEAGSER